MRNIFIFSALLLLFLFLALGGRRYVYLVYQHALAKISINANNIASQNYVEWIKSQSEDFTEAPQAVFLNRQTPFYDQVAKTVDGVLGETTNPNEKWIDINLSEQRLYMKEGDKVVGSFLISSGKWAPTPTGSWPIWIKLRYTTMRGGSKALGTFYDLPNVPYTMYFYQGYGVHGAYWHNNFGHPMSHGCINMRPEEAGIVYNWASVGTKVVTHY